MQIKELKRWLVPTLIILVMEIGFSTFLTGSFTLAYERKSLLLTAIILTVLILMFTPPGKTY